MRARKLIAVGAAALALTLPSAAAAQTPFDGIHAHRGGPNPGGQGVYPENSIEAFDAADDLRVDVIELDVKLTSDGVPVVMHDATLDRTTNCAGQVRQMTAAALAANCRIDTVGTDDLLRPASGPGVRIPTLAATLAWAAGARAKLNAEIKNYPTDPDYDPTPAFAAAVLATIEASGVPKRDVLIQSFLPLNLEPAKARGFDTSLLLLRSVANQAGITFARQAGYDIVSPEWPTAGNPRDFVAFAHNGGRRLPVVPFTIDEAAEIRRAFRVGVDGVISNDPLVAMRTLYGPRCAAATARERRARALYLRRLRALRRTSPVVTARHRQRQRARSARRDYERARQNRRAVCAKVPR